MTPTLSRQFFETFPPDVARAILEGRPLRIHAAKVSVVRDKTGAAFAIDTLPATAARRSGSGPRRRSAGS